jgi:hypothetical protein
MVLTSGTQGGVFKDLIWSFTATMRQFDLSKLIDILAECQPESDLLQADSN